jgi:hypothetical protein
MKGFRAGQEVKHFNRREREEKPQSSPREANGAITEP